MSRITGGLYKGRTLRAPRGGRTRPTSSFVREALFSMVAAWVDGARVLDLFAGTGSLGLEALSRGARSAVFVDAYSCKMLKVNVSIIADASRTEIMCLDVLRALEILAEEERTFDMVFIDPPYDASVLQAESLHRLHAHSLVAPDGLVILEMRAGSPVPRSPWGDPWRTRRWGDTEVLIWAV